MRALAIILALFIALVVGFIGLLQNPSNLFCSLLMMGLPLFLALAAWWDDARLPTDSASEFDGDEA